MSFYKHTVYCDICAALLFFLQHHCHPRCAVMLFTSDVTTSCCDISAVRLGHLPLLTVTSTDRSRNRSQSTFFFGLGHVVFIWICWLTTLILSQLTDVIEEKKDHGGGSVLHCLGQTSCSNALFQQIYVTVLCDVSPRLLFYYYHFIWLSSRILVIEAVSTLFYTHSIFYFNHWKYNFKKIWTSLWRDIFPTEEIVDQLLHDLVSGSSVLI